MHQLNTVILFQDQNKTRRGKIIGDTGYMLDGTFTYTALIDYKEPLYARKRSVKPSDIITAL